MNEDITPVEASLAWLIGKRRREQGGFLGYDIIKQQLDSGVDKKRVGFNILSGGPAREGCEIIPISPSSSTSSSSSSSSPTSSSEQQIGNITSGTYSPCLKRPIAMGYIATPYSKVGTKVGIKVRGKVNDAEVTKLPFVPTKYYKPTTSSSSSSSVKE